MIDRRGLCPAAGHLEIAIRIGLLHPVPCIAKPLAAILLALIGKPADFVVTPNPISSLSGFTGMPARSVIVEFDKIRQMGALPAAISAAAFAAQKDAVEVADLQHSLLRMIRNFLDAQRERMKIEQELPFAHQAATGNARAALRSRAPGQRCARSDRGVDR